jgi:hypothetical protein
MELNETAANAALLLLIGGLLSWQMSGRFKALEGRLRSLEGRMDLLQSSVDGIRSDLTQVALVVGTRPETGSAGT